MSKLTQTPKMSLITLLVDTEKTAMMWESIDMRHKSEMTGNPKKNEGRRRTKDKVAIANLCPLQQRTRA